MKLDAEQGQGRRVGRGRLRGFTLVELLVVLAIVLVLLALVLPAMEKAKATANEVGCASNMRQVGMAMSLYRAEYRGYPQNVADPVKPMFWHDGSALGKYLKRHRLDDGLGMMGGVMVCPADEGGGRCYSMNVWASSRADLWIETSGRGTMWRHERMRPGQMILLAETWSWLPGASAGYRSSSVVGSFGSRPGPRFGGGGGITQRFAGRFGFVNCEIDYSRHRGRRGPGVWTEPRGRANFLYDDGHVEMKGSDELVDYRSGASTLDSWWSPSDYAQQATSP